MSRAAAALAVLAAAWTSPLAAQLSLRLGALRSRYADRPALSAASVSPRLDWTGGPARAALEAGYSTFEGGGWAAQAGFQVDESHQLGPVAAVAITGSANGNWLDGGTSSWRARLGGQLGRRVGPLLLGAGGGAGGLQNVAGRAFGLYEFSAAASAGPSSAMTTLRVGRTVADSIQFTDLVMQLSWRPGRVAVDASGGVRRVDGAKASGTWQVQTTLSATQAIALDLSAGRSPPSPDGFATGFYLSGGARVVLLHPRSRAARLAERLDAERVQVRLRVPRAERVAIAGDWNGWAQVPMTRDGEDWVVTLPIASGAHEFAISIDGGRLTAPDGVPTVADEFGGRVGVMMVR